MWPARSPALRWRLRRASCTTATAHRLVCCTVGLADPDVLPGRAANGHIQRRSIMPSNTVRLHRVLRAPPARTYRAFLEPDAIAKWLPPNGFTCKVQQMDAEVGGAFRMSFTNFSTGHAHSFAG